MPASRRWRSADTLVRSGAIDVLVVDSVAALVPRAELEGEMGDSHMGLHARLMSQALRKITGSVSRSNTMLIFLNQIRMKIGVMFGNPETTTGGNALKFYASIRLEIRRIGQIKEREEVVGNQTRVKVVKNKLAPPFRQVEFDIMYGEGISKVGELIDLGVKAGVVEKSGAWFSHDSQRIGQGRENAKQFLRDHKDVAEAIERKVRDQSGVVANSDAGRLPTRSRRPRRLSRRAPLPLPLDAADHELIAAANDVLARHYRPFWHTVAAAVRGLDGRIWTGIHLGTTVGRMSVCAEPIALGRALLEGDGTRRYSGGGAASQAGRNRPRNGGGIALRRVP